MSSFYSIGDWVEMLKLLDKLYNNNSNNNLHYKVFAERDIVLREGKKYPGKTKYTS